MNDKSIIIILGATASGKTKLAVQLASLLHAEIISADSRQVYKDMNIGTGKDLNEYIVANKNIPYHLIDIVEAGSKYHVNNFLDDFYNIYEMLKKGGIQAILCGGTGMYINSILQNYQYTNIPVDEELRSNLLTETSDALIRRLQNYQVEHTQHADRSTVKRLIRAIEIAEYLKGHKMEIKKRPAIRTIVIGLADSVESRRSKILKRLETRLQDGLIEEVSGLLNKGISAEMLEFYGLEYKLTVQFLQNKLDFETFKLQLFTQICQYAKRQMTYFRKMEKDGVYIHWFQADTSPEAIYTHISGHHI